MPGKVFTGVSWLIFVPIGAASLAWLAAGWAWEIDLVANLGAQCLLGTLPFVVLWAATRRWALCAATVAACLSHACSLMTHRALWWPRGESAWAAGGADAAAGGRVPGKDGVLRVVHFNASSHDMPVEMIESIRVCGGDIVAWTELSWSMYATMADRTPLTEEYPYRVVRMYVEGSKTAAGYGFILSKLPMEAFELDGVVDEALQREFLACVVTLPAEMGGGKVGVISMHPASPREEERWVMGNVVTEAGIDLVNAMRGQGMEVMVLADLNSTPSGVRSQRLCSRTVEGGLRRGKPVFEFVGTYPTRWEWPRTIAIDDVFFSGGLGVRSWRRGDPMGSDHWPVWIEMGVE